MITRNGYKMLATILTNQDASNASSVTLGLVDVNGSATVTYIPQISSSTRNAWFHNLMTKPQSYPGVRFGTGDDPVTLDDYRQSGDLIDNLTVSVQRSYATPSDDGHTFGAKYVITNNNSSAVTIKEVVLAIGRFSNYNASSTNNPYVMFDRTVLDSPVTIPSGEIGTVTYEIKLKFPTA